VSSHSYDPEDHYYDDKDELHHYQSYEEWLSEQEENDWEFECTPSLALASGQSNENIARALVLHGADGNLGINADGRIPDHMQARTTDCIIADHATPSAMARDNGHLAIEHYLSAVVAGVLLRNTSRSSGFSWCCCASSANAAVQHSTALHGRCIPPRCSPRNGG
jgi:hypothetical protein